MIETYNKIDVALDPFPYSGGTTSFESAWMGVPLYVLKGKTFLSKFGESINNNLGMSEWVASDEKEYIVRIIELTSNLNRLSQTREFLIKKVNDSTLFNSSLFANNFDKILWGIWEKFTFKSKRL